MAVRIESHAEPLPGYRLIERLGGGGFGEVWKAEAPGGLHKAIKFVFGDLQEASDETLRAEQELKALKRVLTVRHPYILNLERYDIIDGQLIIVMELADRNLWDRYKECRSAGMPGIPREELLGYMEEAAEALDLMNSEHQLQHLDIKPQNLFLVHNHIKVADFGLVKDLEGMVASVTGGVTPVYAAPETFDGWVSRFCDQYSLAIVYQELLTGHRPFSGITVRQLVMQHLQGQPDLSSLSKEDRPVVLRALAKNPEERHPTCRALVEALRPRGTTVTAGTVPDATHGEMPSFPAPKTMPAGVDPVGALEAQMTRWLRPHDEGQRPARQEAAAVKQPSLTQGDGVLFPALMIGVGGFGLSMLRQVRQSVATRFGTLEALPNCRLLHLDTDPNVLRTATRGSPSSALTAAEILLARLNRPSHYLKSREGKGSVDSWLDTRMLYRIPRSLETAGVRALGRLAFCDNYTTIARRLRSELETCTQPDALHTAAGRTGLGVRTNRPRVYILCSLTGGSGSGMFLDLAYVMRRQLREMGYGEPDVVGLFLLPAVDRQASRPGPLGNAFAALTELNHFSAPTTTFTAAYRAKDAKISDAEPPFNRCILLPLAEPGDEVGNREVLELAGQFLYRDLTQPLGRAVDLARYDLPTPPDERRGPVCQSFGMFRLSFPRQALVHETARQVCRRLVQRWMSKDSKPLRGAVQEWTQKQWAELGLGADNLIPHLQKAAEQALGKAPETAFAAVLEGLGVTFPPTAADVPASNRLLRGAPTPAAAAEPDAETTAEVLRDLERLVGKPEDSGTAHETALLTEALAAAADKLVADLERRVAELIVGLIELPAYRLAGAEEAIRQFVAAVEKVLEHHEPLCRELTVRAAETWKKLLAARDALEKSPPAARRPALVAELLESLRLYPKWRYQSLVLQQVARAYVSLRGSLSDQLRDVNFCRNRLGELARSFEQKPGEPQEEESGPCSAQLSILSPSAGRALFPEGSWNLDGSVERLLETVQPDDLQVLDGKVQEVIRRRLTALVYVCLSSANFIRNLEEVMVLEVERHLDERLGGVNVAELFLERFGREEEGAREVSSAFEKAVPRLSEARGAELSLVAAPQGPAGDRFRELARSTLAGAELTCITSPDDIVFYREVPHLSLAELDQLGPLGYEAYRLMASSGHFTPHNRNDITQWRAANRLEAIGSTP